MLKFAGLKYNFSVNNEVSVNQVIKTKISKEIVYDSDELVFYIDDIIFDLENDIASVPKTRNLSDGATINYYCGNRSLRIDGMLSFKYDIKTKMADIMEDMSEKTKCPMEDIQFIDGDEMVALDTYYDEFIQNPEVRDGNSVLSWYPHQNI